jgi:signal transduction histidine kinase
MIKDNKTRIGLLAGTVAITLGIHYGWILEPIFGPSHWIHAVHGRFCYIPIVIAASWFGLRGGLITAAVISALVLPFILIDVEGAHNLSGELVEIIFYFAIASLTGALIDREFALRRKQEETQLQLERSHKLSIIGQMAASVAHEIKNPLASIKGAVEIIGDESTPAKDRAEFLTLVGKEIRRIDSTVHEFLQYARPRESRMEKLEFSQTVRAALKQLEPQAQTNGITFEDTITDDLFINGDEEKLHQVILNVVLNSIEASPSPGRIEVSLTGESPHRVRLSVRDFGRGIAPKDLSRIFEPFFTTQSSGTGLGLAIVKAIIENHRGIIHVASEENRGTEVEIVLATYAEES